jgi:hypothetical protein
MFLQAKAIYILIVLNSINMLISLLTFKAEKKLIKTLEDDNYK